MGGQLCRPHTGHIHFQFRITLLFRFEQRQRQCKKTQESKPDLLDGGFNASMFNVLKSERICLNLATKSVKAALRTGFAL